MQQDELKLTQQEINLILTRRKLMQRRQVQSGNNQEKSNNSEGLKRPAGFRSDAKKVDYPSNPKNEQEKLAKNEALKKDPKYWDKARPKGWDSHCNPDKIHKGRLTPGHPMYWFEENVFRKITNMEHQAEHKKIKDILGMPVQTNSRDRVYHALCHLDVLWTEGRLPIGYKHRYEEYKKEQGIGDDNIHPAHKKKGVVYPVPKNKRPWNPEDYQDYDETQEFTGKKVS